MFHVARKIRFQPTEPSIDSPLQFPAEYVLRQTIAFRLRLYSAIEPLVRRINRSSKDPAEDIPFGPNR